MGAIVYPGFAVDEPSAAGRALVTAVDITAQRSLLGIESLVFGAPLLRVGSSISIAQASALQSGYLSAGDWQTFSAKQAAIGYTPADDSNVVHKTGDTHGYLLANDYRSAINYGGHDVSGGELGLLGASVDLPPDIRIKRLSSSAMGIFQADGTTRASLQASGVGNAAGPLLISGGPDPSYFNVNSVIFDTGYSSRTRIYSSLISLEHSSGYQALVQYDGNLLLDNPKPAGQMYLRTVDTPITFIKSSTGGYADLVAGGAAFSGALRFSSPTSWRSYGQTQALDTTFDGNNLICNYATFRIQNNWGSTLLHGATGVSVDSNVLFSAGTASFSGDVMIADGQRLRSGSGSLRLGTYAELVAADTFVLAGLRQSIVFGGTGAYCLFRSDVPIQFVDKTTTTPMGISAGTATFAGNLTAPTVVIGGTYYEPTRVWSSSAYHIYQYVDGGSGDRSLHFKYWNGSAYEVRLNTGLSFLNVTGAATFAGRVKGTSLVVGAGDLNCPLDIQAASSAAYTAGGAGIQYNHAATGSIYNLDATLGSFAQLLLINRGNAAGWVRLVSESRGANDSEFAITLTGNERLRIKNNGDTTVSGKTTIGSGNPIILDGVQVGIDYCNAALGQWNLRSDNTGKLKIGRYSGGNTHFYDNGLFVNELTGLTNLVLPNYIGTDSFTLGQYTLRSRAIGSIAFEIYSSIAAKSLLQLDRTTGNVTLASGATLLNGYGSAGLMPAAIASGPYAGVNGFAITDYYGNKTGYLVGSNNGAVTAILAYDRSVAMEFASGRVTAPGYYASGSGYPWSPSIAMDLSSGHEGGFYRSGTKQVWGSERTDRVRLDRDGTVEVLGPLYVGGAGKTLITEDGNGAVISQPTGGAVALKVLSGWVVYSDNSRTVHLSCIGAVNDGAVRVTLDGTLQQLSSARWVVAGTGARKSQVGDGAGAWQTGYREEYNASGLRCGFYDATPVERQQIDSGSATLAADLLAALTNLGLVQTL